MRKRVWPILLASGMALAMLLTLGVWQMQRLQWKTQLIAAYDKAMSSEAVPLSQALAQFLGGQAIDGMKVKLTGRFAPRDPLRMLSSLNGGPAWTLVQGFEQFEGPPILVNRGKISQDRALPETPQAAVEIVGHLIWHDKGKGAFDQDNDVGGNRWYWWDMLAMANQFSATHIDPNYLVLDLVAGSPGTEGLHIDPPKAGLRNNHLGYAITWFGLAIVLIVMTVLFARARVKDG